MIPRSLHCSLLRLSLSAGVLLAAVSGMAQTASPASTSTNFGSQSVGVAGTQLAVTFNIATAGTLGTTKVLTQGLSGYDFTLGTGSTCINSVAANSTCTVYVVFKPTAPTLRQGAVQLTNASGTVIATAYLYGLGLGPLAHFPGGTVNTAIGNGTGGYNTTAAAPLSTELNYPNFTVNDAAGNIYIADKNNNRVREYTVATGTVVTIAGTGNSTPFNEGVAALSTNMTPTALALDGAGNLYISDSASQRIRKLTLSTGLVTTIAGTGTTTYNGDGISGTAANIGPANLALDVSGNVYFADQSNNRIRKLTVASNGTNTISTVAGNGTAADAGDGGLATAAEINNPDGVELDPTGAYLYLQEYSGCRVRQVTFSTGKITTIAGSGGCGYGSTQTDGPTGGAVDGSGNVWFGSQESSQVYEYNFASGTYGVIAGTGGPGYTGNGGAPANATFLYPNDVSLDNAGNYYISDAGNNVIREVTLTTPSPASMAFGTVNTGTSQTQTSTIRNDGNANLVFSSIALSGGSYLTTGGTCSTTSPLTPGSNCTVTVTYAPTGTGTQSSTLTIADNSPTSPHTIPVSGTAYAPQTITWQMSNVSIVGATAQFAATSSSGLPLTFSIVSGNASLAGSNGVYYGGTGSVVLQAAQVGNSTYAPATSQFTVTVGGSAIAVGTLVSLTATVTIGKAGTIGSVGTYTQGVANEDYIYVSGGTCAVGSTFSAGNTCTVFYQFAPAHPWVRKGGIAIGDTSGNLMAAVFLSYSGDGPQTLIGNGSTPTPVTVRQNLPTNTFGLLVNDNGIYSTNTGDLSMDPVGNIYEESGSIFQFPVTGGSEVTTCSSSYSAFNDNLGYYNLANGIDGAVYTGYYGTNSGGTLVAGMAHLPLATGGVPESCVGTIQNALTYPTPNYASSQAFDAAGNLYANVSPRTGSGVMQIYEGSSILKTSPASFSQGLGNEGIALNPEGDLFFVNRGVNIDLIPTAQLAAAQGGSTAAQSSVLLSGSNISTLATDSWGDLFYISGTSVYELDYKDPPSLSFAATAMGSTSTAQTLTITNNGNQTLTISSITASTNFVVTGGTCAANGTVAAASAATCTIQVAFEPTVAGTTSGTLTIADNSVQGTHTVSLSGIVLPTVTGVSPNVAYYAGGTTTNLTGTGFSNVTAVMFGTVAAIAFTVNSSTSITATVPAISALAAGTTSTVDVTVTANGVTTSTSTADQLTYYSATENFVVTTLTDDASGVAGNCAAGGANCSLRDAMAAVSNLPSATTGQITFLSSLFSNANAASPALYSVGTNGTLSMTTGSATITGPVDGNGNNLLAVDGGNKVQVLNLSGPSLAITHLTIQNGNGKGNNGGGIQVTGGSLTLTSVIIENNQTTGSGSGGGMAIAGGTVALINSTVFVNHVSVLFGGGIYASGGTTTLTNSTVAGNTASSGGGIYVNSGTTVSLNNSTLRSNVASGNAGGIVNYGTVTFTNTTVTANNSSGGDGGFLSTVVGSSTTLINTTVHGNTAYNLDGGGYYQGGSLRMYNTLITDPISNYGVPGGQGNVTSSTSLPGLASNGGPTQTILPAPGDPAICGGLATISGVSVPSTDQRGVAVGAGGYCPAGAIDSGAVQTDYNLVFTTQPTSVTIPATTSATVQVDESTIPYAAGGLGLMMQDIDGIIAGEPFSGSTGSNGAIAFNNLSFTAAANNEQIYATFQLGGNVPQPISTYSNPFNVTVLTPAVTGVSPNGGPVTGGTIVTITGTNFTPFSTVNFGSVPATKVVFNSATSMTVTAPAAVTNNAIGTVDVTVTTSGLTSAASPADQFTYYAPVSLVVTTLTDDAAGSASNCTAGSTSCSLRDAIAAGSTQLGQANITFDPSTYSRANGGAPAVYSIANGTLNITSGIINITGPVDGSGLPLMAIDGGGGATVVNFAPSGVNSTMAMTNLIVQNGSGQNGGGIATNGTTTLTNVTVTGNAAASGGGLSITGGTTALINTTVSYNTASSNGAGVIITGGSVVLNGTTLNNNVATGNGGAIANLGATVTMTNTTMTANYGYGSGVVYTSGGTTTLMNVTMYDSGATNAHPGLYVTGGTVNVFNSAIEDKTYNYTIPSSQGNVIDIPLMNPLGNYGGPAWTLLPPPAHPAICAGLTSIPGLPAGVSVPTVDQRGYPVGAGGYCPAGTMDAGAVQTDYTIGFVQQPVGAYVFVPASPAPEVSLLQSGFPYGGQVGTFNMTLTDADNDIASGGSAQGNPSVFNNLIFSAPENSDSLTATISLQISGVTGAAPTTLTATSNSFPVVVPTPVVTGISPNTGVSTGGTVVTISGQNFIPGSVVDFGGLQSTNVTYINATTLTATAPVYFNQSSNSIVDVTVLNAGQSSTTSAADQFTYLTPQQNYVVTTLTDDANGVAGNCVSGSTNCSLRDALAVVNALPSGVSGNITFDPSTYAGATNGSPAVYSVTTGGTLNISAPVTITGPVDGNGKDLIALDGGGSVQVLSTSGNVAMSNLFVQNGNSSGSGGGLSVTGGSAALTNMVVRNNSVCSSCTGGGIYASAGTVTVTNSTISGNRATGQYAQGGGGLFIGYNATLTMTNSTVSGNSAAARGGGLIVSGTGTLTNTTVSGNTALYSGGGIVASGSSSFTLMNTTVSGNSAGDEGSGMYLAGSVVTIVNSLVPDSVYDGGSNTVSYGPGYVTSGGTLPGLANNGGLTQTILPAPGNPAICGGVTSASNLPAGVTIPSADQRGVAVNAAGYCPAGTMDAGAVQTDYALAFLQQPPATIDVDIAVSPAPEAALTENNLLYSGSSTPITIYDVYNSFGQTTLANPAVLNNAVFSVAEGYDYLTASTSLQVTGLGASPTALTVSSQPFAVVTLAPTVTGVLPNFGPSAGGTVVTITGTNFTPVSTVSFGGNPATNVTYNGATSITATAPAASAMTANSTVDVTVATAGVSSATSAADQFTYDAPLSYVVTTLIDDASGVAGNCTAGSTNCSLRDAIAAASALSSGIAGNITFAPSTYANATNGNPAVYSVGTNGTLNITSGVISITGPVDGSNNSLLAIDGGGVQVMAVSGSSLALSNLIVRNGNAAASGGGLLVSSGNVTLTNVTVVNNTAKRGGGVAVSGGAVTLTNTIVSNNQATLYGGGLYLLGGTATLTNSTVSGNTSPGNGGGLMIDDNATLTNTTVTGNTAYVGGGLEVSGGTLTAVNMTLSGNTAQVSGPGIFFSTGSLNLYNSLVPDRNANYAIPTGQGNVTSSTSLSGAASNGGPTQTILPLPGSPAICGALASIPNLPAGVAIPTTDQRGVAVGAGGYCPAGTIDAGAVQTDYALAFTQQPPADVNEGVTLVPGPAVTVTENGTGVAGATVTLSLNNGIIAGTTSVTSGAGGLATFSNIQLGNAPNGKFLTATLPLNPALTPAPAVSANSGLVDAYSLTLYAPNTLTGNVGTAYSNGYLYTYSGSGSFTYSSSTLPPGLTVAPNGTSTALLSGTPTQSGTFNVTVTVTDTVTGQTASVSFTLTIGLSLANLSWSPVTSTFYAGGTLGSSYFNATSTTPGTISYTAKQSYTSQTPFPITATTPLPAGSYTVTATLTPTDPTSYAPASISNNITVFHQEVFAADPSGSVSSYFYSGAVESSPTSGGGIGAAVGANGVVWSIDADGGGISIFTDVGTLSTDLRGTVNGGKALAIDGANTAWVATGNNTVTAVTATGTTTTLTDSSINAPSAVAVDQSGNVWVTNKTTSTVTEIIGGATPAPSLPLAMEYLTPGVKP